MRVLVTGATGLVGRALVRDLLAHADDVVVVSRDPAGARALLPGIAGAHAWSPLAEPLPVEALDGADAVVHLLGESIAGRWTAAKKRAIRETRVESTRNVVEAFRSVSARPAVLVSASAMGYYGSRGDQELDEESGPGEGFLADVAREWEAEASRAQELGLRVVVLRTANVLAPDGGTLSPLRRLFRLGLGGPMGSGRQWLPWVHVADEVGIIRLALTEALSGAVNVVAPGIVRQRDFARTLGRVLGRPALVPAPAWALRLVLGELAGESLSSQRMAPQAALAADYAFRFPDLELALRDLLRG